MTTQIISMITEKKRKSNESCGQLFVFEIGIIFTSRIKISRQPKTLGEQVI